MADTYDPKKVMITFGNQSLNEGIVDGTFLSLTRANRTRTVRVGSDGGVTIVVNNDRSSSLEITYRAGSQTNDLLEDLRQDEDGDDPVYKVGTLLIEDFSGRTLIEDENAFIDGPPDVEFSQDEPSRVWRLMLPKTKTVVRGSLEPVRIGGAGNV